MRIKIYIVVPKIKENCLLRGVDTTAYLSKKQAEKAAERLNKAKKTRYIKEHEWVVFTRWLKLF